VSIEWNAPGVFEQAVQAAEDYWAAGNEQQFLPPDEWYDEAEWREAIQRDESDRKNDLDEASARGDHYDQFRAEAIARYVPLDQRSTVDDETCAESMAKMKARQRDVGR
jgi:hypothetical protein